MKLLLDEMISHQVAERLNADGHDAVAVTVDPNLRGLEDPELFARAQEMKRTVVTYNLADFQAIVREWAEADRDHQGVVFISTRTIAPGDLPSLTAALAEFLERFQPWSGFVHWVQDPGPRSM